MLLMTTTKQELAKATSHKQHDGSPVLAIDPPYCSCEQCRAGVHIPRNVATVRDLLDAYLGLTRFYAVDSLCGYDSDQWWFLVFVDGDKITVEAVLRHAT